MTITNMCKVFFGAVAISMIIGGATRFIGQKMEEKAVEEQIIYICDDVQEPKQENQDVFAAFNELDDGEFIRT